MKTTLPLAAFPGANPLIRDYADHFDRVRPWFHYDPHVPETFERRIAELGARPAADHAAAREAVIGSLRRWGADAAAIDAAGHLGLPGTCTVVTGQQAGIFGGPLYTVLKALSAVKLAQQLSGQFPESRFVPTFWIASGDSDFDEVRTTSILTQAGSVTDLSLAPGPAEDESLTVTSRVIGDELPGLLEQLEELLPGGEFRQETLDALRFAYGGGSLVDGFARWMLRLFAGTGLVLIDPQQPELMACAAGLIERELTEGPRIESALINRNNEVAAAGYPLQVEHLEGDTNLFLLDEAGNREKISREGGRFVLRPSGKEFSRTELIELAQSSPGSFVCGVMLRPVYQNVLFPPAAFIGGAAEIAYRAQTTAVFDFHGEQMAPAFLRATATLLSGKQARLLEELGLELAQCFTVPQDLTARAVQDLRPDELDQAIERYREVLLGADQELQAYAERLDPTLGKSFETLRENLTRHADKLEKKISGALKQKHGALIGQVERLHSAVYPGQQVQERRLNTLSFLPRHGFGLIRHLLEAVHFPAWEHQIVILD